MARRRRRVYKPVKKTIPKIFGCPRCGSTSIKITKSQLDTGQYSYKIVCGNSKCNITDDITESREREIIDVYNLFVDRFNKNMISR